MLLDYDFVEATYLCIDEDGNLKIPPTVLNTLNVNPGDKLMVIIASDCIIIEPKNKPHISYIERIKNT